MFEYGFVKWYNAQRRFGFIKPASNGKSDPGGEKKVKEIWFHLNAALPISFSNGTPAFNNSFHWRENEPRSDDRVVFERSHNSKGPVAAPWTYYKQYRQAALEEAGEWFDPFDLRQWPFLPEAMMAYGKYFPHCLRVEDFYPELFEQVGLHETTFCSLGKNIDYVVVWENPGPVKSYSAVMLKPDIVPPKFVQRPCKIVDPMYKQLIDGGHIGTNNYWLVRIERNVEDVPGQGEPEGTHMITVISVGSMFDALRRAHKI